MDTIAQLLVSGIMLGGIYAVMSIGLTLIFGVLKIVNFAHGEFLMLAMYVAWAVVSMTGIDAYAAMIVVIPVLFGFGMLIYWLIVRPGVDKPHLIVVFATMGLSIAMQNLALVLMSADLRDVPPLFGGTSIRNRSDLSQKRIGARLSHQHRDYASADGLHQAQLYR